VRPQITASFEIPVLVDFEFVRTPNEPSVDNISCLPKNEEEKDEIFSPDNNWLVIGPCEKT
jgi:hypothetical protein